MRPTIECQPIAVPPRRIHPLSPTSLLRLISVSLSQMSEADREAFADVVKELVDER